MDNKVYIVQCPNYDEIEEKLTSLVNLMGGMGKFAKNGEKIVLKANLLREARPEQAVCTHPSVIAAVGGLA
ncbi:MAG: 4Fe-4S ferredoxin, partial [Deltaproteobacteria bacterium]|nr:4Fe-4S ferredoxin [Deltaproteobacteria bacterium]